MEHFSNSFKLVGVTVRVLFVKLLKKIFFKYYIKLKVVGDIEEVLDKYPKLLFISNHSSHLDAPAITTIVPTKRCFDLYVTAAKDYFFSNPFISFFSKHCMRAIPVDRNEKGQDTLMLCMSLLKKLDKVWLLVFPEGTRSLDGKIHMFKKGADIISKKTDTPVLFFFIDGAFEAWPKANWFAKYGKTLTIHVGPVKTFENQGIYESYKAWVDTIKSDCFIQSS